MTGIFGNIKILDLTDKIIIFVAEYGDAGILSAL